jgi:hypothetical protein
MIKFIKGIASLVVPSRITNVLPGQEPLDVVTVQQLNSTLPYKEYVAFITQTGTNAPVATVVKNTLGGSVVWAYDGVGAYTATLAGAFSANKTDIIPPANAYNVSALNDKMVVYGAARNDADSISVYVGTRDAAGAGDSANGEFYGVFRIVVYN